MKIRIPLCGQMQTPFTAARPAIKDTADFLCAEKKPLPGTRDLSFVQRPYREYSACLVTMLFVFLLFRDGAGFQQNIIGPVRGSHRQLDPAVGPKGSILHGS